MIPRSVKAPTIPIPFHKLLKVVAVVDPSNPQTQELLDCIRALNFEVEVSGRFDRDIYEDTDVGAYIALVDGERREQARTMARAVRERGFTTPLVTINPDEAAFADYTGRNPILRELELFITVYYGAPDPVWTTQWFRCAQFDKWNWMYSCNEEYDQLDRAATEELDTDKRSEMYIREQELKDEAAVAVWLIWPTSTSVTRTDIQPSFDVTNTALLWNFRPA